MCARHRPGAHPSSWRARSRRRERAHADALQALDIEADAAHLGEPERAALLEYLGRHALGLSSGRSGAMALVRSLEHAAAARVDPSIDAFRTRLAFLARAGSVDAVTLADAWRLP